MFITLEGPEGGGKTSQAARLAERLRQAGRGCVLTREPGGTPLGDRVREILLPSHGVPIGARSETLLYCAARAQVVDQVILPALRRGDIVVADRFADSTLAYQGFGRQLDLEQVAAVLEFATTGLKPDLTILLDVDVQTGLARKSQLPNEEWNRFEQEELGFHARVREAFLRLVEREPVRWIVLDARQPFETVAGLIWECVTQRLERGSRA
jgi:dTMP kinase